MNTISNKSDLSIIAALFMLLLVYCSVCLKPVTSDAGTDKANSVAVTESNLTASAILK
ncbi:hypothetical protein [Pontibacter qinzhouensis]|uniref:hypothetical protein n=1 Tax=Pontibacter qinzhouensis TaxID=2603253 RepID=UPI001650B770|nr:hypothetical protein [Pontibacter qinzhouensis]